MAAAWPASADPGIGAVPREGYQPPVDAIQIQGQGGFFSRFMGNSQRATAASQGGGGGGSMLDGGANGCGGCDSASGGNEPPLSQTITEALQAKAEETLGIVSDNLKPPEQSVKESACLNVLMEFVEQVPMKVLEDNDIVGQVLDYIGGNNCASMMEIFNNAMGDMFGMNIDDFFAIGESIFSGGMPNLGDLGGMLGLDVSDIIPIQRDQFEIPGFSGSSSFTGTQQQTGQDLINRAQDILGKVPNIFGGN